MADPEDPLQSSRMSLGEHLDELRRRLTLGLGALLVAFFAAWAFHERIDRWMLWPLETAVEHINAARVEEYEDLLAEDPSLPRSTYFLSDDPSDRRLRDPVDSRPQTIGVTEGFFFAFRNSLYFAILLGAPALLWQLWRFIAAGLYERERKIVLRYFPASVLLFLSGVAVSFFLMVPLGIYFLQVTMPASLATFRPTLGDYLAFVTNTCLWAGVVFQVPIVIQVLIRLDLVAAETFARYRRHCVVLCFVVSAIVTPTGDPFMQFFLAAPMWVLYEIGLFAGRLSVRAGAKEAVA